MSGETGRYGGKLEVIATGSWLLAIRSNKIIKTLSESRF